MAAVRAVKPRRTYKEWIKALIVYMTPPDDAELIQFGMINDVYIKESVKSYTRSKRGESRGIVKVGGAEQHMQYGTRWSAFLCNGTNKTELLKLIGVSMHTEEMKNLFKISSIFTTEDKTYELNYNTITQICSSDHEEADARLIFHALSSQNDVVIVCEDTDVIILMVWAYVRFKVTKNWYMKYEDNKYACIKDIVDYIGDESSAFLRQSRGVIPHQHFLRWER